MADNNIVNRSTIYADEGIIVGDDSKKPTFEVFEDDKETPINVGTVTVEITEERSGDTVNGRDGTFNDGVVVTSPNIVSFSMDALDNAIVGTHDYEYHWVKFNINYGSRKKIIRIRFEILNV